MPDDNVNILNALKGGPLFIPPTKGAGLDQSAILNMLMMSNKRPTIMGGGPSRATITGGIGPPQGIFKPQLKNVPWENSAQDLSDTARFEHKTPLKNTLGDDYLKTWATPYSDMSTNAANRDRTNIEKYNYAVMEQTLQKAGFDTSKMTDVEKVIAMFKLQGLFPDPNDKK